MLSIPKKFDTHTLGHPNCIQGAPSVDDIAHCVQNAPKEELKQNIIDAGQWILKSPRPGSLGTTPDTHLYRIRKAEKIRSYISRNHLEEHLTVPKKYIYIKPGTNEPIVVSEKLQLSEEVATPQNQGISNILKSVAFMGGQGQALAEGKPQRPLTPIQAKSLAELSSLGYTDLTYNNLYFTQDGKVAIIDTEPQKRALKKIIGSSKWSWFGDKGALLAKQAITGTAKLKAYCSDPAALKEVNRVERNHALWAIAKLIGKIAIACLAIYFIPGAIALLPLWKAAAIALKVALIAPTALKAISLSLNVLDFTGIWFLSCRPNAAGMAQIGQLEVRGVV